MIISYLLRGLFIGIVFGIPIGAVGILTIQRTIQHNILAGIVSGLGASSADIFYAAISIFGLTFISDFLIQNQNIISIAGGIIIIVMGMKIGKQQMVIRQEKEDYKSLFSYYLSSFIITLTNPVSILSFMVIFSTFGINGKEIIIEKIFLLFGILIGTGIWWIVISCCAYYLKEKIQEIFYVKLNKVFGIIIIFIGIIFIIRVLL